MARHCPGTDDAEYTSAVLTWLHRTGIVYYNPEYFGERVLIDQRWAIIGVYSLFDREKTYQQLLLSHGRFTLEQLQRWAPSTLATSGDEYQLFIQFMQACGMCFELLAATDRPNGDALYVANHYLPSADNEFVSDRPRTTT